MKSLVKNLLLPTLASRPVSMLAESLLRNGIRVFMMHRFADEPRQVKGLDPDYLDYCIRYLKKRRYNFVSIEQIATAMITGASLPRRSVAFTLDDGFHDQANIAAPVFVHHGIPATIFLITDMLDKGLWPWDDKITWLINNTMQERISLHITDKNLDFILTTEQERRAATHDIQNVFKNQPADNIDDRLTSLAEICDLNIPNEAPLNYQAMNWDMARELESQGISFGAHTQSHRILSQLDAQTSEQEISHSWKRVQQELASPCPVFCYPTGRTCDFGQREFDTLRQQKIIAAVSTQLTFIKPHNTTADYIYRLPRYAFTDDFSEFVQYSSWIEQAKTGLLRR